MRVKKKRNTRDVVPSEKGEFLRKFIKMLNVCGVFDASVHSCVHSKYVQNQ